MTTTRNSSLRVSGYSLLELLIVLGVLAVLIVTGLPRIDRWSGQLRIDLAAHELVGALRTARAEAARRGNNVAIKFFPGKNGGRSAYALYLDGNGDGVRTLDIQRGLDPPIGIPRDLVHLGGPIRFGFPRGIVPSQPGYPRRPITRLDDPIRFNRSDLASFSPIGTSTPGSLYLTDGHWLFAVRVRNRSGRVEVLRYDRERNLWRGYSR